MLVGGMLSNAESWINITQKDLENLEAPDIILQKKILSSKGNPSKCFIQLELGIIPIKFILKLKRLNFLHYILTEHKNSMISQVYTVMRQDCKKGDFVSLIESDMSDLEINHSDSEIEEMSRASWKKYIKEKVISAALMYLVKENNTKDKTKDILFSELKLAEYLQKNKKTSLSKIIFHTRSKTLEIKNWAPWKFENDLCVACKKEVESMCHFMNCTSYQSEPYSEWNNVNKNDYAKQLEAGTAIEKRYTERTGMIETQEAG